MFKFVETASFIVSSIHPKKRSVALELINESSDPFAAGNVTIPSNHEIPAPGAIIEARYLYAFEESGSIYQPVHLGIRDEIDHSDYHLTAEVQTVAQAGGRQRRGDERENPHLASVDFFYLSLMSPTTGNRF